MKQIGSNAILKLVWIGIFLVFTYTVFSYAHIFSFSFSSKEKYLYDLFDYSQWRIPQSTRVISDEQLYQVAANKIIQGDSIYSINPEVPPLGKYLYGLGIITADNPYLISFILYILSLGVYFFIAKQAGLSKTQQLLSLLLFMVSPLLFSQIGQTMLDLPQLFFLLLYSYFWSLYLTSIRKPAIHIAIMLSGLCLGFAAATKFPIFIILIAVISFFYLVIQKKAKVAISFGVSFIVGYLLTFAHYLVNHSFRELLGAQKWMLNFYLHQYSSVSILDNIKHFFTGRYQDFAGNIQFANEWTIFLPVIFIATICYVLYNYKKFLKLRNGLEPLDWYALIFFTTLIPMFFLTLYTRYFLLILPFGALITVKYLSEKLSILFIPLFLILFYQSIAYLNPQPIETLKFAQNDWTNGNYQDFYNHLHNDSTKLSRDEFLSHLKEIEFNAQVDKQSIDFKIPQLSFFSKKINGQVTVTLETPAGEYHHTKEAVFIWENGGWKLIWNWEILADSMNENDTIVLIDSGYKTGKIISSDGSTLAYTSSSPQIFIQPQKIKDRTAFINAFTDVTSWFTVTLENYIFVKARTRNDFLIPLESKEIEKVDLNKVEFTALEQKQSPMRFYNNNLSTNAISEIQDFEDLHRLELGLSKALILKKQSGQTLNLLGRSVTEGKNIIYPKNFKDLQQMPALDQPVRQPK